MIIILGNNASPTITFGNQPVDFFFTTQTGVGTNTTVTSNTVTMIGMSPGTTNTIYTDAGSLIIDGTNVGSSGTIQDGTTVAVSLESSGSIETETVCNVSVGTYSTTFDVYTGTSISPFPFGTVLYQTSGGYPESDTNSGFAVGTGNFTLDFTIYPRANMGTAGIVSGAVIGGAYGIYCMTNGAQLAFAIGNNNPNCGRIYYTPALDTWTQCTYQRHNGYTYLFINGVLYGSKVAATCSATSTKMYVGARYDQGQYPLGANACYIGVLTVTN